MPTLQNLVDRVRQEVSGFSQNQQQLTYLTASVLAGDLTMTVFDAQQISRGLIELGGSELAYVNSKSPTTNMITISPFGRGYAGSTAQAWANGTKIENNPIWPYVRIVEAINDTIRGVYPNLYAIGTKVFPKTSVIYEYSLPADAEEVINVQHQLIGPSQVWPYARNWRFVAQADTSTGQLGSTGKALFIADDIVPGRQILVNYRKEPTELVNATDDFASVTGLPATAQDVIVWGACQKLAVQLEGPRLAMAAVEASERAQYVQPGSAAKVSGYFGQLYAQRLEQEAAKLRNRQPIVSHYDF